MLMKVGPIEDCVIDFYIIVLPSFGSDASVPANFFSERRLYLFLFSSAKGRMIFCFRSMTDLLLEYNFLCTLRLFMSVP